MRTYSFTLAQLEAFLAEYAGVSLGTTARDSFRDLLESEAERGNLAVQGDDDEPAEEA